MSDESRAPTRVRRRRSAAEWQQLIGEWQVSGQSQRVFCEQRGLSLQTFTSWKHKLNNNGRGSVCQLVPVDVVACADHTGTVEVLLTNGRVLRVAGGCEAAVLSRLAAALEGGSC